MEKRRGFKPSLSVGKARLRAHVEEEASRSTSPRPPPIIVHIANPAAFDGQGSIIMLELADEACAKRVALRIAQETGRCVTVRNADMTEIQNFPAAKIH